MNIKRIPHGASFDRYLKDLEQCPPLTAGEEAHLALRMRRLKARLVALLGRRPELRRPSGKAGPLGIPFARLEAAVLDLERIAAGSGGAERRRAHRARKVLEALHRLRTQFVTRNLRLAFHLARRLTGRSAPLPDLIQAGNVGLLEAVDRFDPRRGNRFSTYAAMYITRAVYRALPRLTQPVHVSEYQRRLKSRLTESRRGLMQELGRTPTLTEMAARAHLEERKAKDLMSTSLSILELDAPVPGTDGFYGDTLPDEGGSMMQERLIAGDLLRHMHGLLPSLDPRLRMVLRLRYGLEGDEAHTLKECGDLLCLSRERVRQLEEEAIQILRTRLRALDYGGRYRA
ncbi:MAG TPA: sigma-70 family RNA polymerase sigma factor, partial [Candidatus Polarisedimenticolia bacterium]|nr:sigma-70 family RNA polymerase sigma factor [Candidatus Polarisedimenticolia bacterium]